MLARAIAKRKAGLGAEWSGGDAATVFESVSQLASAVLSTSDSYANFEFDKSFRQATSSDTTDFRAVVAVFIDIAGSNTPAHPSFLYALRRLSAVIARSWERHFQGGPTTI